jgi:porphobilinogen synthase
MAAFPIARARRLRRTPALRRLVRETHLSAGDLVAPLFVREGIDEPQPIGSMPGQAQHTLESLRKEVAELGALGIGAVILFGIPSAKDETGTQADADDGIVQRALRELRSDVGDDVVLIADLCLDEYTDHGHCGVLDARGEVDNDATLERYGSIALAQAKAGAHMVAPSGMMDGQVAAIRAALDHHRFTDMPILSYAAKFASSFYGPFRDAAGCAPRFGDRAGYQMDPPNADEAIREARADLDEGADIVMVKPALPYLDVVRAVAGLGAPTAAFHVSGEYAMLKAAGANGWIDERAAMLETLVAIKRAGAGIVLTYFAKDAAIALREG